MKFFCSINSQCGTPQNRPTRASAAVQGTLPEKLGSSADGRQPAEQEKVVAAKRAAVGPQEPMNGLLHGVANADTPKINRSAMRTAGGKHNFFASFLTVGFRRAAGTLDVGAPEGGR
jgi:hypothetical protein